jgi:hypothetical protein
MNVLYISHEPLDTLPVNNRNLIRHESVKLHHICDAIKSSSLTIDDWRVYFKGSVHGLVITEDPRLDRGSPILVAARRSYIAVLNVMVIVGRTSTC